MTEHLVHILGEDEAATLPEGYLNIVEVIIRSPNDDEQAELDALAQAQADTDGMALHPDEFRD